jgi:hypothetical protein
MAKRVHPITFKDSLWQVLRIVVYSFLINKSYHKLAKLQVLKALDNTYKLKLLSLAVGSICYFILVKIFHYWVKNRHGCKPIGLQDSALMHEDEDGVNMIVTGLVTEKFDFEQMKAYMVSKCKI